MVKQNPIRLLKIDVAFLSLKDIIQPCSLNIILRIEIISTQTVWPKYSFIPFLKQNKT
jgi:hypothetical protein